MTDEPDPSAATRDWEQENAELRRRLAAAEHSLDEFRAEALQRRAEVRALAESLPAASSRHALLRQMLSDVRHHPDKTSFMRRAAAKAGRAPRKAMRLIRERT